ncbi:hypothetical protein OTU49_007024 [Cherax quadricarinatus]|uniref:Proteasome assembly chaperone 1 n=2 Tax=Cherax quadricarinatus TaxID=27406 RepID=A0AAW0WJR1_CHEQU
MATFFGEVRLTSSRAYDEEDEEEESRDVKYDVTVEVNKAGEEMLSNIEAVVISHGKLATDFCETLVLSEKCTNIGVVSVKPQGQTECKDTGDFHPRHPCPSHLFVSPQSLLVCCVSKDVTAAVAYQFSQKLLALVKASCLVMVISSHHYGALKGSYAPQGEDNCVVHSLHSPAFPASPVYPRLPQPATLDSLPAAVLTECLVNGRPCIAYSAFTETYSTGDLDLVVDALVRVFQSAPFRKFMPPTLTQGRLHHYRDKNHLNESLDRYM